MNVKSYNLESLRLIVRKLMKENETLKNKLRELQQFSTEIDVFESVQESSEPYDENQGERILDRYITRDMARLFFSMFWGREDVYAKRGKNGGYFPQCENRWQQVCPRQRNEKAYCEDCKYRKWKRLTPEIVLNHLVGYKEDGSDVIGVYPLLSDGTCRFLVFDFDNHIKGSTESDYANENEEWKSEVDSLRLICKDNGINALVERSRSGRGAHVWILFNKPIPAKKARNFGYLLLDVGITKYNLINFHYYDRMYPSQDYSDGIGNLVALPLQGRALKNGNSAFVDENWNAYPDQWEFLLRKENKLNVDTLDELLIKWSTDLAQSQGKLLLNKNDERVKPWRKNLTFDKEDVVGKLHVVLADGLYVDTLNIMPKLQNQIRCLAAFDNPIYYKNKNLGYSNYYNFSALYMGKDENGYIHLPRGCYETLEDKCKNAGISIELEDQRSTGRPIRVEFNGELRVQQDEAVLHLLSNDFGILSAATAFGKTAVCSYMISQRKVSTLILLQNKDLLNQWREELNKFLIIDEQLPTYTTKAGKIKRRNSVIGELHGSKDTLTGIVDVAMIGSVMTRENKESFLKNYGMVIVDECHHAASATAVEVLKRVSSKYVYGASATVKRSDQLERIIYMLLGPIRHSFTAKQRAEMQGIDHLVYPRYTRAVRLRSDNDINRAYDFISHHQLRNEMIIDDVLNCVANKRTPLILTKYKEHAKFFYDCLVDKVKNVIILYGGNSDKENLEERQRLKDIPKDEPLVLIATGQKIGEGFDYPRLDTLMLASPVSFDGRLEQYIGRLNRDYPGKENVIVYDYVDSHIPVFDKMYSKRLRTYKKTGYVVSMSNDTTKKHSGSIFDSHNYVDVFEQDITNARESILISSPDLTEEKIERFIYLVQLRQENGVGVIVRTLEPEYINFGKTEFYEQLIYQLRNAGIEVILEKEINEHFAIFDEEIVWHGGMNLLGRDDIWDNLIRIYSKEVAQELLEIIN